MFTRIVFGALVALAAAAGPLSVTPARAETVKVNGLDMYYEIHGKGEPLVLLHGAYMSIDSNWRELLPTLSETRKVIALELQAHGRTSDAKRPITYEGMADDVAQLLKKLKVQKAAVFGYSMGGGVAIRVAMQHPELVSRLIVASASTRSDAYPPEFRSMIEGITPELFKGSPMEAEYLKLAPNKQGFPTLVEKLKELDLKTFAWPDAEFAKIAVPTLLIYGDADVVSLEHAVKLHKLLGGVMNGDQKGLPKVQLMVLPGTTHVGLMLEPRNVAIIKNAIPAFLKQTLPAPPQMPF